MDSVAPALGQVIRKHRLAAGPSQEGPAERSGLHWTYVCQVERGGCTVSVEALRRIGAALGVPGWRLLQEAEAARGPEQAG